MCISVWPKLPFFLKARKKLVEWGPEIMLIKAREVTMISLGTWRTKQMCRKSLLFMGLSTVKAFNGRKEGEWDKCLLSSNNLVCRNEQEAPWFFIQDRFFKKVCWLQKTVLHFHACSILQTFDFGHLFHVYCQSFSKELCLLFFLPSNTKLALRGELCIL